VLTLLDLSAAFDSVDHETLLSRLQQSYGLDGTVFDWFHSYLSGRTQCVHSSSTKSVPSVVSHGVPQGSDLGPILFTLYAADELQLLKLHKLHPHAYVDDMQIYGFCHPSDTSALQQRVSECVDDVTAWMTANRLQLNHSKTEILWCSSQRRQHQIPTEPIRIGDALIPSSSTVRDLGVYIDANITMKTHVTFIVRSCFASLRQLRSIRRSIPPHALQTLIRALVISRIDYCSSVLAGMPGTQLRRLQSVLNAAAQLIFSARRHDNITSLLRELHWLRFPERIKFRLCVLAYQYLHGAAPSYLAENVHMVTDANSRVCLRSASQMMLRVPATRRSTLGDRAFPVAAARAWNSLPPEVKSAPSLETFRRRLKTHLFNVSF
jgi:hypothetical protein